VGEHEDADDVSTTLVGGGPSTATNCRRSSLDSFLSLLSPTSDTRHASDISVSTNKYNSKYTKRGSYAVEGSVVGDDDNASIVSGMTQNQSHRRDSIFGALSERRIQLVMQLDEQMFAPDEMLGKAEAQALLLKSTLHPEVLVGWKVTSFITDFPFTFLMLPMHLLPLIDSTSGNGHEASKYEVTLLLFIYFFIFKYCRRVFRDNMCAKESFETVRVRVEPSHSLHLGQVEEKQKQTRRGISVGAKSVGCIRHC